MTGCVPIPCDAMNALPMDEWTALTCIYVKAQSLGWRPFLLTDRAAKTQWGISNRKSRQMLDTLESLHLIEIRRGATRNSPTVIEVFCPEGFDDGSDNFIARDEGALDRMMDGLNRKSDAKRRRGAVYLIQSGDLTKIGFTEVSPGSRVASMQTGNPMLLHLVGSIAGTPEDEASLHAEYAAKRVRGEWFALNDDDVYDILRAR